jgi:hypothetical protein
MDREVIEQVVEVLDGLLLCPYCVDEATVPSKGVDYAPNQVVLSMSVSLGRLRKAREAVDALRQMTEPPKPEWVGLTDEEINNILGVLMRHYTCEPNAKDFAKAIEAKLKEKNHG